MDYQPAKFQFCKLSLANFIDKLRRHFMLPGFENLKFCKTEYRLSFLQALDLLVVQIEF